jgi:hypothetical protein
MANNQVRKSREAKIETATIREEIISKNPEL